MTEERIGSYIIEGPVGRGGMGVVYKARHTKLPRVVAIKSIDPHFRRDLRRLRHRFEREAFVQSQLDHPAIVKIYDYVVSEQTYHIVMEFVEGRSLAEELGRQEGGRLEVDRALDLFEQILEAVAYAHCFVYRDEEGETRRGMIHRDLKPPNIMVTPDDRIKITDFGIVKLAGATETDTSGLIYGSPHYVSPEQAAGANVDQRSDVYSLGVILYEMLTGVVPFGGGDGVKLKRSEILRAHVEQSPRPPSEINPAIWPELQSAVCGALEKKPERRFGTAFDFWRAVRRARGRDTKEIDEQEATLSAPDQKQQAAHERQGKADTGRIKNVTGEVSRDTYTTQPMTSAFCDSCGAEAEAGDARCRACGLDLKASPATKNLTRQASGARKRARLLWAALAVAALAAVALAVVVFFARGGESPAPRSGQEAASNAARPSPTAAAAAAPTPDAAPGAPSQLLTPERVTVDSSFDGYDRGPLTDGVTDVRQIADMRYNKGNWVSSETSGPHWVQLDFDRPVRVTTVYVFWGFDRNRYMPSRRVELQVKTDGDAWKTVAELEPGDDYDRTAFKFAPFEARSVRIHQPAEQGPASRPFVMWVREVQAFGVRRAS